MTLPFRQLRPASTPMPGATPEFDALFMAHYSRLCQLAYRMTGSRVVAEDIVQDLFLTIWARGAGTSLDDPVAYLYTAIRNRSITHVRRERWRMSTLATRAMELWRDRAPESDPTDAGDIAVAVNRAIQELPARRREIFTLHREQHLSYAEIARVLGISIKTVETQMGRALKLLRARLAPFLLLLFATLSSWTSQ